MKQVVEWYEEPQIEAIEDMVDKIENEYDVKLYESFLETLIGTDKKTWKVESKRWARNLIDELEGLIEEIDNVE